MRRPLLLLVSLLAPAACFGQDDEAYGKKIREFTTEPFFLTDLVDHLPASSTVPTPERFLGYVVGAPNVLTHASKIAEYLRLLEKSSPRVRVISMGKSEEGREMVVAVISDEANLARLTRIKQINARLGDPRGIKSDQEAEALIAEGLPMYWATGGMHAPETGPPEMLMELAYRLAVSEKEPIKTIRKNSIVMLTPVLDVDGRERSVDLYRMRKANPDKPRTPLVYWGKYVAHDDNRDGMALSLELSKAMTRVWMDFKPTVFHDLHESVPYLYISTGTGPYNAWIDPITVDEWHILAYNEINELTRRGVPGVWTHGFYDGWAASYGMTVANGHNAIGRFYETFSGGGADTGVRSAGGSAGRDWYRPNPPFPRVRWSIRNNVNLSQSALLLGMAKVAGEKEKFLRNYYTKAKRSVAKARAEGPAAYVFPSDDRAPRHQAMLLEMISSHGVEVHQLASPVETADGRFPAGSYVIRMDQPYSRMADMILDTQYYNPTDPRSYDDTGWTLGPLFNTRVVRCKDVKLLDAGMTLATTTVSQAPVRQTSSLLAVKGSGEVTAMLLRLKNPAAEMFWSDEPFEAAGQKFEAGTLLIRASGGIQLPPASSGTPLTEMPKVKTRPVRTPRIALVHTWNDTQDEGWFRLALDRLGVPYRYVSVHEIRDNAKLRESYDVILFPPGGSSAAGIVNGIPKIGDPMPWKPSALYPNLGGPDTSDDIRGGIELQGVVHLKNFLDQGGLLICVGESCQVPINYNLVSGVSIAQPRELNAPGGVYLAENVAKDSPVLYGYGDTLGVYFNMNSLPILQLGSGSTGRPPISRGARPSGRGSLTDPDVIQGRPPYTAKELPGDTPEGQGGGARTPQPRVLLRYAAADKVLLSGMIDRPEELAGKAALILCPVGKGNVLLFSLNPMWRMQTVGSYPLLFNAAMSFDALK